MLVVWAFVYISVQVGHTLWVRLCFQLDAGVKAVGISNESGELLLAVYPDEEYVIKEAFVAEGLECGHSEHGMLPIGHEDVGEDQCVFLSHHCALEL